VDSAGIAAMLLAATRSVLVEGKDVTHIANHLAAVSREFMDMTNAQPDMRVAGLLVQCADDSQHIYIFYNDRCWHVCDLVSSNLAAWL
jgi:hypothetical protein